VNALEAIFSWVLTTTWQASVLAVLVLLAQWLLGARLNPRWRHALWLLVVLRLVLPALPASNLSLYQIAPAAPLNLPEPFPAPQISAPQTGVAPPLPPGIIAPQTHHAFPILTLTWLSGALGLLLLTWLVNRRFARQVANAPEITDAAIRQIFAEAQAELGVRRSLRLVESAQVSSPAIMGLFTPTLLLPADARDKFTPRELRYIFLHELAHLKRGDVAIQALIALLQIIHWFNPVLWYAFRRLRADREPATDALVLSRTGEADKEPYGLMLIKLLGHFNQRHALPTLVGILEDKDQFKRRFSLIARFTRGAYGWSLLGVLLVAVLAAVCLTKAKATPLDTATSKAVPAQLSASAANPSPPADGADESLFYEALQRDRTLIADPRVHSSTLAADAEMLLAIQKGDVAGLKKVLEHAVDPNAFDPDRFDSTPLYWAVHFNQPECVKLLLDHFAKDDGPTHRSDQSALKLAQKAHPELVPMMQEGLKRNEAAMTAQLKAQLQTMRIDLPAFSNTPLEQVTHFLIEATAKAGYLERRVGVATMDLPPATIFTSPAASQVTIWQALQILTSSNNLRFDVSTRDVGTIMFYPSRDETIVHPANKPADTTAVAPSSVTTSTTTGSDASKPQIEVAFVLVQIAESTYQQQTAAIDNAVKNGNIAFLVNLHGASVVSSPRVTTFAGQWGEVTLGKKLIQGDKSTPVTTLTATSTPGPNGKVTPSVVQSQSTGPTQTLLGIDFKTTPSLTKDGTILLPIRYQIGYVPDYKSPTDFATRTSVTDQKLSLADGQSSGFFLGYENASSGDSYNYSLLDILNSPGNQIKALPPLSPSPNRLALIVTAQRVTAQPAPPTTAKPAPGASSDAANRLLAHAAGLGDLAAVQKLIAQGADPNSRLKYHPDDPTEETMSPLKRAVLRCRYEVAAYLLGHGAKEQPGTYRDASGHEQAGKVDEMNAAEQQRDAKMVKLFWDHGIRSISELSYAITQGASLADVTKMLDAGQQVDPPQDTCAKPLAVATLYRRPDLFTLLLQRGAKADNGVGATALDFAAGQGQDAMVAVLLQHGAQPRFGAFRGAAAAFDSWDGAGEQVTLDHYERIMRLLLDTGAIRSLTDIEKGRVLSEAVGHPTLLKMLLDAGLSPELPVVDPFGKNYGTVLTFNHDASAKDPGDAVLKASVDLLEAADKAARKPASDPASPPPAPTSNKPAAPIDLNRELLNARMDADARRVMVNQVKNLPDDEFVATLAGLGRTTPEITALDEAIAKENTDITNLTNDGFADTHPRVVSMRAEVAEREAQRHKLVEGLHRAMDIDLQMADSRVALLQQELALPAQTPAPASAATPPKPGPSPPAH
jgi:bla regulator protein BlaR1